MWKFPQRKKGHTKSTLFDLLLNVKNVKNIFLLYFFLPFFGVGVRKSVEISIFFNPSLILKLRLLILGPSLFTYRPR